MMDYLKMFDGYDTDMERKLKDYEDGRPKCSCCGEVIMEDFAICINDEWFCDEIGCRQEAMEAVFEVHKKQYRTCVA